MILTNARLWGGIADDADRPPRAVAIGDGRVLALGAEEEIMPRGHRDTKVIDLHGARVVPGLIDSHLHAIRGASSYIDEVEWNAIRTLQDGLATISAAAAERGPGAWILVLGGWYPAQLTDEPRMPTPTELTAAAPDNPVFVHPLYGHDDHAVLNARALDALGWADACPDPAGGTLDRDAAGRPTGVVRGLPAYALIASLAAPTDLAREVESSRLFFQRMAAVGLTGVVDAGGLGMSPDKYQAVRALWRQGRLPIRVRTNLCPVTRGNEPAEVETWEQMLEPALGDEILAVLGLGEVVHFGCHDWEGMVPFPITDEAFTAFVESLRATARRRWPVTIHAILESSISKVLDGIEAVAEQTPIDSLRWNLCHAECISATDLARVKRLGLGLAIQGRLSQKMNVIASRWGEDTARDLLPLGQIRRLGIPFGAGTDGTRAGSYNPWQSLWYLITGRNVSGGPLRDAANRLSRPEALDAYTRGSAWFSFEDDIRGVLRPGSLADLAVLDSDYFTVPDEEIPLLASNLTLVAGRIVHRSGPFADLPLQDHDPRPGPQPL
jgi:predicted amidohydrolase YtcJ